MQEENNKSIDVRINENERVDDLHRNGYKLIQDPKKFCFGVDAVLLSGFCRVKKDEKVLDMCTGTGIIPILLCAKTKARHITGIEIQPESVEMARRNVVFNGLTNRIQIDEGDIRNIPGHYKKIGFDHITCNPPYIKYNGGIISMSPSKAIARHEMLCSLEDVISVASGLLQTNGRFSMVHKPERLADIVYIMRQHAMEPKRLRFVYPYVDKEPVLVLIEAAKDGKPFLKVMQPLIIYKSDGSYTDEVYGIYYK